MPVNGKRSSAAGSVAAAAAAQPAPGTEGTLGAASPAGSRMERPRQTEAIIALKPPYSCSAVRRGYSSA